MRPRGYDPSRSTRFYDPRTGAYSRSFEHFLQVADAIGRARDRAERYYDRAVERIREGVPQARAGYWRRRLSETRADLAEANAFWREIDEQLTRETPAERRRREKQEAAERDAQQRRREAEKERRRREEPRATEFSLNLDYDRRLGAQPASEVDLEIRFWRNDHEPMTMLEAWAVVNHYRSTGEFPDAIQVEAINWLGIAAKRRGRPRTEVTDQARIEAALTDFFGIVHAVAREDLKLEGFFPLRLGSVKEDG